MLNSQKTVDELILESLIPVYKHEVIELPKNYDAPKGRIWATTNKAPYHVVNIGDYEEVKLVRECKNAVLDKDYKYRTKMLKNRAINIMLGT